MITTRFIVTCVVLGGLTVALAIAGYFCAIPIVEWKMSVLGSPQLVMKSPSEPAGVRLATALMFAWPGISTIAAAVIHRWRRQTDASVLALLSYFAIPVALLAGYIWLRTHQIHEAIDGGRPIIALLDLAPGTDEARLVVFISICVWIFIGVRKPPKF
jgi:hypothetical protein